MCSFISKYCLVYSCTVPWSVSWTKILLKRHYFWRLDPQLHQVAPGWQPSLQPCPPALPSLCSAHQPDDLLKTRQSKSCLFSKASEAFPSQRDWKPKSQNWLTRPLLPVNLPPRVHLAPAPTLASAVPGAWLVLPRGALHLGLVPSFPQRSPVLPLSFLHVFPPFSTYQCENRWAQAGVLARHALSASLPFRMLFYFAYYT